MCVIGTRKAFCSVCEIAQFRNSAPPLCGVHRPPLPKFAVVVDGRIDADYLRRGGEERTQDRGAGVVFGLGGANVAAMTAGLAHGL